MSRSTQASGGAALGALLAGAAVAGAAYLALDNRDVIEKLLGRTPRSREEGRGGHGHGGHGRAGGTGEEREQAPAPSPVVAFEDGDAWARRFDTPERVAYMKPDVVIAEVVAPLLASFGGGDSARRVIADVGAGTGLYTLRLAAAFPQASILASDVSPGMRAYLGRRVGELGCTNVTVVSGGTSRPGLPTPGDVLLLVNAYHHLDDEDLAAVNTSARRGDGSSSSHAHSHSHGHGHGGGGGGGGSGAFVPTSGKGRIAWLRSAVDQHDVNPGGFAVVIEHKEGRLPIEAPPEQYRLSRSRILHEFEAAGWTLVAAPGLLDYHHVLVFAAPSAA